MISSRLALAIRNLSSHKWIVIGTFVNSSLKDSLPVMTRPRRVHNNEVLTASLSPRDLI